MNYLSNNRHRRIRKSIRVLILVSIILLFLIARFGSFGPLSYFFNIIVTPIWKVQKALKDKTSALDYIFRSKNRLATENELLKQRLREYRVQSSYQDIFFNENKKLKEILRGQETEEQFILAAILTKPNRSPYDTLIIDLGRVSGVKKSDQVFAQGNVLIGRVEEVYKRSSKITLFSTAGEKLDVVISGQDIYTTATGRGGGNFEITLPRDIEIEVGTVVLYPGITPYIVGIVEKINYDPRDPLQKIFLGSPVNIQHLKFVSILNIGL